MAKILRRFLGSYLRALAAVTGTLFVGSALDWVQGVFWQKVLLGCAGALIAPLIKLLTDWGNALDPPQP